MWRVFPGAPGWSPKEILRISTIPTHMWPYQLREAKKALLKELYVLIMILSATQRRIKIPGRLHGLHIVPEVSKSCATCWLGASRRLLQQPGPFYPEIKCKLDPPFPSQQGTRTNSSSTFTVGFRQPEPYATTGPGYIHRMVKGGYPAPRSLGDCTHQLAWFWLAQAQRIFASREFQTKGYRPEDVCIGMSWTD